MVCWIRLLMPFLVDVLYAEADVKARRQIIGSIFPEKLVFDGYVFEPPG